MRIRRILTAVSVTAVAFFMPALVATRADGRNVNEILESMTSKEKIAQMLMPSFSWSCGNTLGCNKSDVSPEMRTVLEEYNFAGIILFGENIIETEQTVRLVDALQRANASNNFNSQLLIATDQEGGYVTRLAIGTNMPGNMALGATSNPALAKEAVSVIGRELMALGINVDFAPVSDVNNNPANPIIGVRSFSDSPEMVGEFASQFMSGLESAGVATALKHFPGHGDTATDTHSSLTVVDKSYMELKNLELVPFKRLASEGTDMIMTAHIQYPQIETGTYTSIKPGVGQINLPATLSEKMISEVLRTDMGYNGVVVTDALNMGAIADHFDRFDVAKLAINAGVDMLLMPVAINGPGSVDELRNYIDTVAGMVDSGVISEAKVNAAVTRILNLKENHGLLGAYNEDVETMVSRALGLVSTKSSHDQEFDIAKKAVTLVKNTNEVLPLDENDKTLIAYYYDSQMNSAKNALKRLVSDGVIHDSGNVVTREYIAELDTIKSEIENYDNVVIFGTTYTINHSLYGMNGSLAQAIDQVINAAREKSVNVIYVSTQLPYDLARFDADAMMAVYLASGLGFDGLENMETSIPKYGANVIAGVYQLFNKSASLTGKLPVNIYALDNGYYFTDRILYARGYGLGYKNTNNQENNESTINAPNAGAL